LTEVSFDGKMGRDGPPLNEIARHYQMTESRSVTIAGIYYVVAALVLAALCLVASAPDPHPRVASLFFRSNAPGAFESTVIAAAATFVLGGYILLRRRFSRIEGAVGGLIALVAMWYGAWLLLVLIFPIFIVRPHEKRSSDA